MPFYAGRVKCIFIDPPYNTQSAFEHYDDRLEHSQWLSMMYPRLVLLRDLLSEDGSIWVTIDDNEAHYLKVLMDEVFSRRNGISTVIWEKSDSPRMDAQYFSSRHDTILAYAKNLERFTVNKLVTNGAADHYDKKDDQGRLYYLKPLRAMGGQGDSRESRPNLYYSLQAPDGTLVYPKRQDGSDGAWRWSSEKVEQEAERIEWRKGRNSWTPYYRIYAESNSVRPPETIWFHQDVGSNRTSKAEVKSVVPDEIPFGTPKPEALLQRILHIASDSGDLVLDSFLGSGTTAAVAHKMGRRYIGIEMGEHARTHCVPRLEKVVAGEQGGISKAVEWKGGGGFSFLTLGEPAFDENGRINPAVEFRTLAAYIWQIETGAAGQQPFDSPFLGVHDGKAYFLLYNGILGDRRPAGGNVLNSAVLAHIRTLCPSPMPVVVYGETSRVGPARLAAEEITFRQIPYDISMR
ncbi:site-specific DNA-methyltransferase [Pandoraea sp. CB10b_02]|uniref:site-specific DNA-methyltransferase n=1 Tax=Pandoraea sp. CB10b_02 TaxID=2014535 RepID=UPI00257FD14C|nr:site-specific DNA-methyltransferase [Pandoraea sp. CB10b_02]